MKDRLLVTRLSLLAGAAFWSATSGTAAIAQAAQPAPASAAAPAQAAGLGEIVVTAQRRAEKLNDVGISVVAASGDQLISKGVKGTEDLVKIVPGLTATETPYGTPVLTLRGVGFYESSLSGSSPVAAYDDEIPLPYTRMAAGTSFDLQRVEVLKGPQGTLYGQNSTGGAINFIANKPTDTFHAGFDGSLGRFMDTDVQGFVSGPITDTLKFRVAVRSHQSGDWQKSVSRDDTTGATHVVMGRVLVDWQPVSRLKFELNLNGFIDKSDSQALAATSFQPNVPAAVQPNELKAVLTPPGNDRLADWDADKNFRRNNWYFQTALKSTYSLTDTVDIISITAYQHYKENQLVDADATDAEAADARQAGFIKSFSQELRLQGTLPSLKYVLGGNFSRDSIFENTLYIVGDGSQSNSVPGFPIRYSETFSQQVAKTYAAFANADYEIVHGLNLQGGIRYTKQDRSFDGCLRDPVETHDGAWARLFSHLYNTTIPEGGCTTYNPATNTVGLVVADRSEHNISWRAALNYKPSRDTLVYASISRGYKQGSYPTVGATVVSQYTPAKQESLLAYEVGAKLSLLDRKVQLNTAAFYYDYSDKQLRGKFSDPFIGTIEQLINIPKSRVYGMEMQLAVAPARGLSLQGNVTYANSRIQSRYQTLTPIGQPTDLHGQTFELTPKWSANGSVDYDRPVGPTINGFVGLDVTYQGHQHGGYGTDATSHELFGIDAYALLDLRVGVRDRDDKWRGQLWVRNLTNKYYWTNANYLGEFTYRQTGRPRTYGVSVSYRY